MRCGVSGEIKRNSYFCLLSYIYTAKQKNNLYVIFDLYGGSKKLLKEITNLTTPKVGGGWLKIWKFYAYVKGDVYTSSLT
jgi:hypothetical protein